MNVTEIVMQKKIVISFTTNIVFITDGISRVIQFAILSKGSEKTSRIISTFTTSFTPNSYNQS